MKTHNGLYLSAIENGCVTANIRKLENHRFQIATSEQGTLFKTYHGTFLRWDDTAQLLTHHPKPFYFDTNISTTYGPSKICLKTKESKYVGLSDREIYWLVGHCNICEVFETVDCSLIDPGFEVCNTHPEMYRDWYCDRCGLVCSGNTHK